MPRKYNKGIAGVSALDLSFAMSRLIAAGTTTAAEVKALAAERIGRMKALEEELAALRHGKAPALALPKPARAARKPKKIAVKRVGRPKGSKNKVAKGRPGRKPGASKRVKIITRKDGRKFTRSLKVLKARQQQGRYIAFLRRFAGDEKEQIRSIARENGVPAALEEINRRLA